MTRSWDEAQKKQRAQVRHLAEIRRDERVRAYRKRGRGVTFK